MKGGGGGMQKREREKGVKERWSERGKESREGRRK